MAFDLILRLRRSGISEEKSLPELSHIDPGSAALLVMDYQVDTLTKFMTTARESQRPGSELPSKV
jgi:hypothetical protein